MAPKTGAPANLRSGQNLKPKPTGLTRGNSFSTRPSTQRYFTLQEVRSHDFYVNNRMSVSADGVMPFARYVVLKKGLIAISGLGCNMCHTRVMPDGSVIKGAQGNLPEGWRTANTFRNPNVPEEAEQSFVRNLMAAPWLADDPHNRLSHQSKEKIIAALDAMPPGTMLRQGAGILFPPKYPISSG